MWDAIAAYPALYISAGFVLGLLVGSFLNVVILRLPRRMLYFWHQQCLEHLQQSQNTLSDQTEVALNTVINQAELGEASSSADHSSETASVNGPENSHGAISRTISDSTSLAALAPSGESATTTTVASSSADAPPASPAGVESIPPGIVYEPSHCMVCQHQLSAWENIPVISYLLLRGRCRSCGTGISIRYPIVELLTAVLTSLVLWKLGFTAAGLGGVLLTWALIALCGIDWDHQLLPDSITLPLLWLGFIFNLNGSFTSLDSAVIGAITGYGILWMVFHAFRLLTGKEGMGYGDFKLTAALGAWLGWQMVPMIILAASLSGSLIGLALILSGRQQRQVPMPFGPYLAIGAYLSLLWGESVLQRYLAVFPQ